MNNGNETSFEDLNFFIDGELTRSDRLKMLEILDNNDTLSKTVNELQRNDELIYLSYNNIPEPQYDPYIVATQKHTRLLNTIYAGILIILSFTIGWQTKAFLM